MKYHQRISTVALSSFSAPGRDEYQIEKSLLDEYGWRGAAVVDQRSTGRV